MDNTSESLSTIAISIGLYQMIQHFKKIYKSSPDELNYYSVEYVLSGIIASLLWTVYQYRKGSNISVVYSAAGLFLGMYTFLKMLKGTPDVKKE